MSKRKTAADRKIENLECELNNNNCLMEDANKKIAALQRQVQERDDVNKALQKSCDDLHRACEDQARKTQSLIYDVTNVKNLAFEYGIEPLPGDQIFNVSLARQYGRIEVKLAAILDKYSNQIMGEANTARSVRRAP